MENEREERASPSSSPRISEAEAVVTGSMAGNVAGSVAGNVAGVGVDYAVTEVAVLFFFFIRT